MQTTNNLEYLKEFLKISKVNTKNFTAALDKLNLSNLARVLRQEMGLISFNAGASVCAFVTALQKSSVPEDLSEEVLHQTTEPDDEVGRRLRKLI